MTDSEIQRIANQVAIDCRQMVIDEIDRRYRTPTGVESGGPYGSFSVNDQGQIIDAQAGGLTLVASADFTSAFSVPNNTLTTLDFDNVIYDPNGWITTGAAWNFEPTIAGNYLVVMSALITNHTWNTAGNFIYIGYNHSVYADSFLDLQFPNVSTSVGLFLHGVRVVPLAVGEIFTPQTQHTQGSTINYSSGIDSRIEIYQG